MDLTETMFTTPEMSAVFSAASQVQRMLDFEAALARAQAGAGLIPSEAAEAIAARCRAELFDLAALSHDAAVAGTPAIPLVRMLTGLLDGPARRFVHWGATSQDAMDTGMMLQTRDGLDLLAARLLDIAGVCAALAERHRHTPMAGRTLLQHAVPITFGLKAARWLALTTRLVRRLRDLRARGLAVQLGGAAGTLAALGQDGIRVTELLARELDLAAPALPWHAERDRVAEIAAIVGIVAGAMAKVATDMALLAQTEVGEASTRAPAGAARSSAMPHKRNPAAAITAIAAARLAMGTVPTLLAGLVQEHERAAGGWQAEWDALPRLFRLTAGAVEWVHRAVEGLEVDPARMRANLGLTDGLIMAEALMMALAPHLGRDEAYRVVQRASDRAAQTGTPLQKVAAADEQIRAALPPDRIERAFDVAGYLGSTDRFIDRALDDFRAVQLQQGAGGATG
ncbi:MAG: 3-carboxy-cis,cis-muconate cycloisomerase [Armatimonadetes bacterium]|nr:3-carboxy-cis,cis-muconate cycloisomerase [Armatimonadota bacterium]